MGKKNEPMIDIHCGDCTTILNQISVPSNSVIVTDPPFNIDYKYKSYGDKRKETEYLAWLVSVIGDKPSVLIHYPEMLFKIAKALDKVPQRVISWCYNSNTARQHRDVAFFGVKPVMKQVTQPYKNPNDKRIKKRLAMGYTGAAMYDWFVVNQVKNVSKAKNGINHPCTMPLEVMERIVGVLPKGVTVIDPFMGAGTTGMACKKLGYDFIGIELDKDYFRLAQERIKTI